MDNHATYKTAHNRFAKRPRWHVHFAPASASWRVERFFGLLTEGKPKRGAYAKRPPILNEPSTPIVVNDDPKPFRWTGR